MGMKKFVCKLITFFAIVAIITLAVNFVFIKQDKSDSDSTGKFKNIPATLDVCNFGSSHGQYGFNYEDATKAGYDCFNFGLTAQYLTYDYRLIKQYGDRLKEGSIVFIPVSYFSLIGDGEQMEAVFALKNKRYYSILSPELIKDYDLMTDIYVNYLPSLGVDTFEMIKTLLGKGETAADSEYDWLRISSDIDLVKDAEEAYTRHIKNNEQGDSGEIIVNQQELEALYEVIDACKEKGATPILITTPLLSEYTDKVMQSSPDFLDEFYSIIDKVVEDTDVMYCDYAFDERFINNYDWFMNVDHLNKEGARIFTDIVFEEVMGIELTH